MTDETNTPAPAPEAPEAPEPPAGANVSASWDEVVGRMTDLGDAIAGWARAAADDPENRKHLDQVRQSLNDMSAKAAETFSEVAKSDFGKSVAESASQAGQAFGDAATNVGQAAAPHVASAFAGLADVFGKAAAKVSESTPSSAPTPPTPPAASAEGESATTAETATPAEDHAPE